MIPAPADYLVVVVTAEPMPGVSGSWRRTPRAACRANRQDVGFLRQYCHQDGGLLGELWSEMRGNAGRTEAIIKDRLYYDIVILNVVID